MGHYSSDFEDELLKQRERWKKDLAIVEEHTIKAQQNLPLNVPCRIKDAFGQIRDYLTAQKHV